MGMWIELGIFGLVLVFGFWQLHDVGRERRKRQAGKDDASARALGDQKDDAPR